MASASLPITVSQIRVVSRAVANPESVSIRMHARPKKNPLEARGGLSSLAEPAVFYRSAPSMDAHHHQYDAVVRLAARGEAKLNTSA
jgi:hypothetical protein